MHGFDDTQLRSAVYALDPIVALLALIHQTGDRTLLHTYRAAFDGVPRSAAQSSFSPRDLGAPKEADPKVIEQIRERLIAQLADDPSPLLTYPDRALFQQMAEFCIGMPLRENAVAMGREQAGFSKDEGAAEAGRVPDPDFNVLILGGGMVGLIAAIKLKAAGFDYQIIEREDDVGGTWYLNTYPNVAVDTASVQYSLSFEQNASWSKYYPRGAEYLSYLQSVADKYQIKQNIHFSTEVKSCEWDDSRRRWTVTCVSKGETKTYEARAIINAFGFLTKPSYPKVEGLDKFEGKILHSGYWEDDIEVDGKNVVVVGTGATSAQLTTNMAGRAAHVTVVQRQPNYMMPDERTLMDVEPAERWALENIPFVTQWRRFQSLVSMMTLPASPGIIDKEYRERTGGVSAINEGARQVSLRYIESKFADYPEIKRKVTPDFPFFAKRPILDCGYYDTLKKPNVDLLEGSLERCEKDAVVLADGTRIEADVVVLATGYTLAFLSNINVQGKDGRTLKDAWDPYPFAYKGLEVPGFPNFFITSGPNSGLTASHTTLGEQQVHYVVECLKAMVEQDLVELNVSEEACRNYCREIDRKLEDSVWVQNGTAHGYYRHETGRVVLAYPGTNLEYWSALRKPNLEDYDTVARD